MGMLCRRTGDGETQVTICFFVEINIDNILWKGVLR